jgi:hypothetical protein
VTTIVQTFRPTLDEERYAGGLKTAESFNALATVGHFCFAQLVLIHSTLVFTPRGRMLS